MIDYDITFCTCGRIHYRNKAYVNWVAKDPEHRALLSVCTHCGNSTKFWLDRYDDGLAYNSSDVSDFIVPSGGSISYQTILSNGVPVILKDGSIADDFCDGIFINQDGWDKATKRDYKPLKTYFRRKEPWCTVDMDRTILNICSTVKHNNRVLMRNDDTDRILRAISSYYIKGFNWKGTPYETEYNSF